MLVLLHRRHTTAYLHLIFFPLLCTLFSVRMIFTINIMLRYIKQPIYSSNHCFTEYVTLSLDLIWMAYYCFEIVANIWLKWFPSDLFQKCSLTFSIMLLVWQGGKPSSCQRKNILLYTFFPGISTYFSYLFWVDFWLNIWIFDEFLLCIKNTTPRFVSAPIHLIQFSCCILLVRIKYLWDFPMKADLKFKRLLWLYLLINNILHINNIPLTLSSLSDITSRLYKLLTSLFMPLSSVSFFSFIKYVKLFFCRLLAQSMYIKSQQKCQMYFVFSIGALLTSNIINVISHGILFTRIYLQFIQHAFKKNAILLEREIRKTAYCFADMLLLSFEWSNILN